MKHIKFFLKKLGITFWFFIVFVFGLVASVFAATFFDRLFLNQLPHDGVSGFVPKLGLALYALAIPLIAYKSFTFARKAPRRYASAIFWGSFALVMLYSLSSALSPHIAVTSAAKEIAGGHPYCMALPDNKPPRALAFVEMPQFFSFMGCRWPKDYDAAVYVEKAPDEYEVWHIDGNKRYKIERNSGLKAVPCQTETDYVGKPWPRPQAKHISAFIDDKTYKFPGARTTTLGMPSPKIAVSGSAGIYQLSAPVAHPRYAESEWHWRSKEEILQDLPPDMKGWRYTPGPIYYQTKADIMPAADIVCESSCFLRFHKEPFDYSVEISRQKIGEWQQIYEDAIAEVESWRVKSPENGTAPR
ncbi:MAG TPA: hypothetical protein PLW48_06915 [Alphaproteobacteria bacterium]|nr:hypothetical protein [Rhodospirillaceae bacterium]HRJ66853.1 hypothetical protein [Alphaproteobacteria bacterium]